MMFGLFQKKKSKLDQKVMNKIELSLKLIILLFALNSCSKQAESLNIMSYNIRLDVKSDGVNMDKGSVNECVFVVVDNKVRLTTVKTGIQDNFYIQILEGVSEGDAIVTAPYKAVSRLLDDGEDVKVVDKEDLFKKKE